MTVSKRRLAAISLAVMTAALGVPTAAFAQHANWGLIELPGGGLGPMKGVYFFPGQPPDKAGPVAWPPAAGSFVERWTKWPLEELKYTSWDEPGAGNHRASIVADIQSANANTIVMSYWGDITERGPMYPVEEPEKNYSSYQYLFDAITNSGSQLRVLPAIEGQRNSTGEFPSDALPILSPGELTNNWLYNRVNHLVNRYLTSTTNRASWARMTDRIGQLRYAFNLLHVTPKYPNQPHNDTEAALGLALSLQIIADRIEDDYGFKIGFTIDPFVSATHGNSRYEPQAKDASTIFSSAAMLGLQAFNPELTVGGLNGNGHRPCPGAPHLFCPLEDSPEWDSCLLPNGNARCVDNNSNISAIIAWKRDWIRSWVEADVPVMLDLAPGYDGHLVFDFPETPQNENMCGVYGDHAGDALFIDDRWRNGLSQMKRVYSGGKTLKGVVYNAWNGWAEALTAVPSHFVSNFGQRSTVSYDTDSRWLEEQFSVDPRYCDHKHYIVGASFFHVLGDICHKWQALGAERDYGSPTSSEKDTPAGLIARTLGYQEVPRMNDFQNGGSIYWGELTGAHEVHGDINARYSTLGQDNVNLGLPTSDEFLTGSSCKRNTFQAGWIQTCGGVTTDWVDRQSPLLFYKNTIVTGGSGPVGTGKLVGVGSWTNGSAYSTSGTWTHVAATRGGKVFFYRASTGAYQTGTLSPEGLVTWGTSGTIAAGYTHITSVGSNFLFLYNATAGSCRTLGFDFFGITQPWATTGGATQIQQIAGAANGALFWYGFPGQPTRGHLSTITASGTYVDYGQQYVLGTGWTDLTTVGSNVLVFYNRNNGNGMTSLLTSTGGYANGGLWTGANAFPAGSKVVGAKTGALFLFDPVNNRSDTFWIDQASGQRQFSQRVTGYGTWTNIVAQ